MLKAKKATSINDSAGFRRMFAPDRLSLGVFFPIEAFERDEPSMRDQPRLARRAEELDFTDGAYLNDLACDRLHHSPLAPPAPYRKGVRIGRSAYRRAIRPRRRFRRSPR